MVHFGYSPYRGAVQAAGLLAGQLLALPCCSLLIAQQFPAPADAHRRETVFSVTTSLVQVDAVVTDSKGHYITDLTASDFVIEEDGKPQKITNLSYIQTGSKPAPRPSQREKPPSDLVVAPSAPLRREEVRRTIAVMVDDLGLSFESTDFVRRSLRKFIETQMQPGDLVAICRTASASGMLQQFTSDKRILLAAVDALRWDPRLNPRIGYFEPYGKYSNAAQELTRGNVAGASGATPAAAQNNTTALDPAEEAELKTDRILGALGALNHIVGAMREMPGRKSIVLFSDGMVLSYSDQFRQVLHQLVDRANRAGTVIYTMLTSGVLPAQLDAQDRLSGAMQQVTQVGTSGSRDVQYNKAKQGLAQIAVETGGIAFEPGNNLNFGLDRVLEDQEGYYLIGYKPDPRTFQTENGSHGYLKIQVKVTRPGLHVRSRAGFFGATDEETRPRFDTPEAQLRAAMVSPFNASAVRLRLTALYAEVPKQGAVVRNLLHIDARDLKFRDWVDVSHPETIGHLARIQIYAVATGADDQPVAARETEYELHATDQNLQQRLDEGVLYTLDIPVKTRGAYQIHVAVRDAETGKLGSASELLVIPDLKKDRVALTSVVLQQADRPAGTPAYAGMTPITRQFHAGGQLEYFSMVEKGGNKSADKLDTKIRIVRDGRTVYSGPAKQVPMDGGGLAILGGLKLGSQMSAGDYYLEITAANPTRRHAAAAQWTDFEILP
jgi:VWFA-related protein